MKTTLLATVLAMAATVPLVAYAAQIAPVSDQPAITAGRGTLQSNGNAPALGMSAQPQFVGPYEVQHGLLPNGLTPNPFNYG